MDPSGQVSPGNPTPTTNTNPGSGQPQVGAGATNPPNNGAPITSPVDGGDDATGNVNLTPEQMQREITRLRRLEAEHRTARHDLEAWKADRERADMSDLEKVQADLATSERKGNELATRHQETVIALKTQLEAQALHFVDPADAAKLLDAAAIEFDDAGVPKNLSKLLADLAKSKPYLVAAGQQPAPGAPRANPGNPTNAASGSSASAILTEAQIAAMTPQEFKQNRAQIFAAMREGRIRP